MRLTNVAHMVLPPGRVTSLSTGPAGVPGAVVPISYDQRLHTSAGDRAGSWMALAFRLDVTATPAQLAHAWSAVVARHGTLHTAFSDAGGELTLRETELVHGDWVEHPPADPSEPSRLVLRRVLDESCRPFATPSHRLCVVTPDEGHDPRPVVVIAGDHAHLDMWSLLVLLRDLRACLADVVAGRAPGAGLSPAPPFAAHTLLLEQQDATPHWVGRRWAEVLAAGGGSLPVFPLPLGDVSEPRAEVVEVRDVLDPGQLEALEKQAADHGVRLTALAIAEVAAVTTELSGHALRAVFPVHSRDDPSWYGSVGWFITNSVLDCTDPSPTGCAAALREAMKLGAHPLAPILGHLDHELAPPGMFALSWLDTRRLPEVPPGLEVQWVSAVTRPDGVMAWFLAGDDGLHLRCRYPDTPQAREHVGRWLDAVVGRLAGAAGAGSGSAGAGAG
ncbi:condensation domain-containing protein [Aeromicrobium sp.]|uniref:condensation domain-containing protein n=1 Tax=Aeromicrobium sp. TaxID=1871063 RepID=UPI0025C09A25|nr:condensation domain-containing protein [Aeromicrobium sp.]MCK5891957.1 peptide synthetase [Aeromicrobium sp.]